MRFVVPALAVWSLVIWAFRVRNIVGDDELSGNDLYWRLGLAGAFILFSLWVVRSMFGLWRDGATDWLSCPSGAALGLALLNIVVWPIRAWQVLAADWDTAFKAVHTALAVVSVVLGLLVVFYRYGRTGNRRAVQYG